MTKKINDIEVCYQQFNLLYIDENNLFTYEDIKKLKNHFNEILFFNDEKDLKDIEKQNIDLVFANIELKTFNIFKVLKKLKKDNDNLPIIIFSSNNEPKSLIKAIKIGINDYVKKPFKDENLKKIVEKVEIEKEKQQRKSLSRDLEKLILKNSIITKIDLEGSISYVNDSFCQVSGFKKDELVGKHYSSFINKKENIKSLKSIYKNLDNQKFSWKGKVTTVNKTGNKISLYTTVNPLFDKDKRMIGLLAVHIDITFEEKMKNHFKHKLDLTTGDLFEAQKLNTQYEMAINESNIISKTDLKGRITYVNDKFCEISGYTKEELIGKPHNVVRHTDTSKKIFNELWRTVKSGKTWKGIVKNRRKDGTPYWVSTSVIPIKDNNNKIKEFLGIRHDLTELFELHNEIQETQREMLYKMGEVSERRSKETGNHVKRVAQYSKDLALLCGLDKEEANLIFAASPMHDIGKVGIPDEILKKTDKLTNDEFEVMKSHAHMGYMILKNSKRPVLKAASIIAREHHEKYDGSGYPRGLKGDDIHIYGRLTAVADVFDALGSHRYYKKAWEDERIFDFFEEQKGKHFDPKIVDIFMDNIEVFLETRNKFQD